MLGWLIALGYLAMAGLASRPIYGWLRAKSIEGCNSRWRSLYRTNGRFDTNRWNQSDRPFVVVGASTLCLLWPLILLLPLCVGVFHYMTGSKLKSWVEIEDEKDQLERRITELERELGIG